MELGTSNEKEAGPRSQRLKDVLMHPVRTRMAAELRKRSMSVVEIAEALDMPLPQIAYHYRILERFDGIPASQEDRGR